MSGEPKYYSVGFIWNGNSVKNQLSRFQKEGIWENGYDDEYTEKVKAVPVGSQIAAKTSYTRKKDGKTISVLGIHGIGTVTANPGDGKILKVDWQRDFKPFTLDGRGAYRSAISKVNDSKNIELIFGGKGKSEEDALSFNEDDLQTEFSLNQILFGPPGTGKTYHTINKAVSIIDNLKENSLKKYYDNRSDLKERFDELLIEDWDNAAGQIAFVSFHQSMSYENFVEGIKPGLNEKQEVIYNNEPGIFKMMVAIARDNWLDANKGSKEQLSFEEAFSQLKQEWEVKPEMKFPLKTPGNDYTILDFSKSSIHFKKANGGTGHTLSISTLRDYFYGRRVVRQTGVGIYYPALLDKLKSYQPSLIAEKEEKNYVLIIDEINRGNVSQIFGELITLIEEDKRLGKDESLELTLPYSQEKFGVPPNLYIIGTMNTADRSVEALDTALRRRFSFVEMPPRLELEELKYDFAGINVREILKCINSRLEKLLDKDHLIGHSFFIKKEDESTEERILVAFTKCIIPLLQEYFFGDYGKIGLVLGSGFVQKKDWDKKINSFADFDYESSTDFEERDVYEIVQYPDLTTEFSLKVGKADMQVNFEKAIRILMNHLD